LSQTKRRRRAPAACHPNPKFHHQATCKHPPGEIKINPTKYCVLRKKSGSMTAYTVDKDRLPLIHGWLSCDDLRVCSSSYPCRPGGDVGCWSRVWNLQAGPPCMEASNFCNPGLGLVEWWSGGVLEIEFGVFQKAAPHLTCRTPIEAFCICSDHSPSREKAEGCWFPRPPIGA
jgi:hypothetical protein